MCRCRLILIWFQKYVGGAKSAPTLSKIGSERGRRRKQRPPRPWLNLAGDMIMLQALAMRKPGCVPSPDSHCSRSSMRRFPYPKRFVSGFGDCGGQARHAKPRPMDRLICGDVGYRKTESRCAGALKRNRRGTPAGMWRARPDHRFWPTALPTAHVPRADGPSSVPSSPLAIPTKAAHRGGARRHGGAWLTS